MLMKLFLFLAGLGLVAAPSTAHAGADPTSFKPTLVVQIQSIDVLFADVKHLASLAGREEEAKQFDGLIKSKIGPKGLDGIDTTRPVGLFGTIDANLTDSSIVLLVPIADEKAVLGLLENLNFKATKEDDGVYSVVPEGLPFGIYFRFANKYAYVTVRDKTAIEKKNLLDPAKVFSVKGADTILVSANIDQIPDVIKQIGIGQAELRLADLEEQKPAGETQTQQAFRVKAVKEVSRQVTSVIKDGGEVTLRLGVDRKANGLFGELTFTAKAGSELAANITSFAENKSLFAGLLSPSSAVKFVAHGGLPESLREGLGAVVDEFIRDGLAKEQDRQKRAHAEKLAKAIAPSLKAGTIDAAANLKGPGAGSHYTLVAGIELKDGDTVERTLRELLKELPQAEQAKIKLDADSSAGVKIHRIDAMKDYSEDARRVFGDNPFYVAFRKDALFVAGGEGSLDALKGALAAKPGAAPMLVIDVSVARLAALAKDQKAAPIAQKVFSGADKDQDRIRLSLEGGNTLKARFHMNAAVIRFISLMDKESKEGK